MPPFPTPGCKAPSSRPSWPCAPSSPPPEPNFSRSAARRAGRVAWGGGVSSGGVGPPRPARSPQGCDSGERVTQPEGTPPPGDRPRLPRAPDVRKWDGPRSVSGGPSRGVGRRGDAVDRHVHAGGKPRRQRALQGGAEVLGTLHVLAVSA